MERGLIEKGRTGVAQREGLPEAVEKGTAEAYTAIVKQENPLQKQTAKNTGDMVKEQKQTNEFLKHFPNAQVVNLGLA